MDYREYTYASGRIPGGFFKREGKPAEKEVLTSRLIDRPIRPLFPSGWFYETQIVALLISADTENDSDVLAITGASAALAISSMPFEKTIAGVRVGPGRRPVRRQSDLRRAASQSKMDLIVAGSADAIMMVEAGAKEATEEEMIGALDAAHQAIKTDRGRDRRPEARVRQGQEDRRRQGRSVTSSTARSRRRPTCRSPRRCASRTSSRITPAWTRCSPISSPAIPEGEVERRTDAKKIFKDLKEKVMRDEILERGQRLDGRRFDEIRPIWIETGVLPRVHGSAVFTRGETQALVSATLGTEDDAQKIETVEGETYRGSCSTTTSRPSRSAKCSSCAAPAAAKSATAPSRNARSSPLLPAEEEFPYTRPRRLRHPRVQRVVVDGLGVRRRAGADGRRRAPQGRRSRASRWAW